MLEHFAGHPARSLRPPVAMKANGEMIFSADVTVCSSLCPHSLRTCPPLQFTGQLSPPPRSASSLRECHSSGICALPLLLGTCLQLILLGPSRTTSPSDAHIVAQGPTPACISARLQESWLPRIAAAGEPVCPSQGNFQKHTLLCFNIEGKENRTYQPTATS